jgi:hypothetical protein
MMAVDVEAAGAMVTASLIATQLGGDGGSKTAPHEPGAACANCQTPLSGKFCHACGQVGKVHRSLFKLGEEIGQGMMRFDAKGWRTIPMLIFRPGQLTRRYIDGQRARFVSPLGLFLFMTFLMFFVFSFTVKNQIGNKRTTEETEKVLVEFEQKLAEHKTELVKAEQDLVAAKAASAGVKDAEVELRTAQRHVKSSEKMVTSLKDKVAKRAANKAAGLPEDEVKIDTPEWLKYVRTGDGGLDASIKNATKNPELAIYKIKNTAYKFAFLLVPISLPFLWLMFVFRRGVTLYDHAVFSLYSLSFMSLLFSVISIAGHFDWDVVVAILLLVVPPVHMFTHLRGTYGLGKWGAFWRTSIMIVVASIVFVVFLLLVLLLAAQ